MRLPDVNVLVNSVNVASPGHGRALDWLRGAVEEGHGLGLAWVALLGFVRVSTRPGIFSQPLPVEQALALMDRWLRTPGARILQPGPRHAELLGRLLRQCGTAGNLTTDAHLAALAIEHGAIVGTFDRDFRRFEGARFDALSAH